MCSDNGETDPSLLPALIYNPHCWLPPSPRWCWGGVQFATILISGAVKLIKSNIEKHIFVHGWLYLLWLLLMHLVVLWRMNWVNSLSTETRTHLYEGTAFPPGTNTKYPKACVVCVYVCVCILRHKSEKKPPILSHAHISKQAKGHGAQLFDLGLWQALYLGWGFEWIAFELNVALVQFPGPLCLSPPPAW